MFAGRSLSVAAFVTVSVVCSGIVVFAGVPANTGATLTSVTTTVKLFVTLTVPSLTTLVTVFVPGPSLSPGVQVITPDALITALPGAFNKE